ncbi:hypothetical protein IFM89_038638 [Coptis chinensis]|uniref:Uncharacterized protein n=1 Tax=Coptis chinensis TaxID=261450 RepID=A0A835I7J5_9MAGN|nr:hypothetical protein IFM89_038638 [Coptis chinensis]
MLLAVEGGGFFSSSATGYSKGLTLLLLGRKNEEKPMRVSPWNQYQLVEQVNDPDLQLASGKNQVSNGCAAFICFGRASSRLEGPSPPKVGPTQQRDLSPNPHVSAEGEGCVSGNGENEDGRTTCLKSSLKKPSGSGAIHGMLGENDSNAPNCTERRKVQWTDASGQDLVEIREFELSDVGASDEEFEGENERSCVCAIM